MTPDEINRKVAEALGMRVNIFDGGKMVDTWWKWDMGFLGISGLYWRDEPQDYCTSAFGADLVRQEIERRGWAVSISALPAEHPEWFEQFSSAPCRYAAIVSEGTPRCSQIRGAGEGGWCEALCLAFLAAHESQVK